eukprot:gene33265-43009_t
MHLPRGLNSSIVYSVEWDDALVFGGISMLDLYNQAQVSYLFSLSIPKVLLVYDSRDLSSYNQLLSAALPLAKKYLDIIKIYLCPTDTCSDVLSVFQLSKGDLPRLLIDDTAGQRKFVHPSKEISLKSFESFIAESLSFPKKQSVN